MKKIKQILLLLVITFFNSVVATRNIVVYRGVHQEIGNNLANIRANGQDGESFFVHNHAQFDQATYDDLLAKIDDLKNSGPVKVKTVYRNTITQNNPVKLHPARTVSAYTGASLKCEEIYASAYDWIVQYYIQEYIDFVKDLRDANSGLRKLLSDYGLNNIAQNFLVSTSLNARVSAKYASGLMSSEDRKTKLWTTDANGNLQFSNNLLLGYVDIFVIPEDEFENLGIFSGVEALTSRKITLYTNGGRDRQGQEEIVFPFLIPGRFHVHREPMRLQLADFKKLTSRSNEDRQNKENLEEALEKSYIAHIEQIASNYIQAHNLDRIFLYDLAPHFPVGDYIKPSQAVAFCKEVESQEESLIKQAQILGSNNPVIARFAQCAFKFEITVKEDPLDFTAAYALFNLGQRMPLSVAFDLEFEESFDLLTPVVASHGIFAVKVEASDFDTIDVERFSTDNRLFNRVKHKLYALRIDQFFENHFIDLIVKNFVKENGKYRNMEQANKDMLDELINKAPDQYNADEMYVNPSDELFNLLITKIDSRKHPLELAFDVFLPLDKYCQLRYHDKLNFFCANDVLYKKLYGSWSVVQAAANSTFAQQRSAASVMFS